MWTWWGKWPSLEPRNSVLGFGTQNWRPVQIRILYQLQCLFATLCPQKDPQKASRVKAQPNISLIRTKKSPFSQLRKGKVRLTLL
jgi:hypothetical protein